MDCSPPASSVHGILWARMLEWVAMPSLRGFSQPRSQTQVSHETGGFSTVWATREGEAISKWMGECLTPVYPKSAWYYHMTRSIYRHLLPDGAGKIRVRVMVVWVMVEGVVCCSTTPSFWTWRVLMCNRYSVLYGGCVNDHIWADKIRLKQCEWVVLNRN